VGADFWEGAEETDLTLDSLIRRSEVAVAGVDGGGNDDLYGLAVLGRCRETRAWLLWVRAWAHPEVFERRKSIATTLQGFVDDGDLIRCEGAADDIEGIVSVIVRLKDAGLLPESAAVGLDSAGVVDLVDALSDAGITDEQMKAVGQGWKLTGAIKGSERRLKSRAMVHGGQRLLAWCVSNAKIEQGRNSVIMTKMSLGVAKIDPLIAAMNAVMLMGLNPVAAAPATSPWDDPSFSMAAAA
jgi:phage terminase large subunit-like protein